MGYQTPNIDRLAKEGMMFTDSYGEQSCTADARRSSPGRA
jgi:arylsulfatase